MGCYAFRLAELGDEQEFTEGSLIDSESVKEPMCKDLPGHRGEDEQQRDYAA
jgi:hypothetical protein